MKIIACYKCVPYSEEITVNDDRTLNLENASLEIGQYDLRAVETAMRIKEADGESTVAVLSVGGEAICNSKMKKAILSRGPAEMFGVQDSILEKASIYKTAAVLAAAVKKIGGVDLVICGEGSSDMYAQQVGNVLGGILGWNTVNAVCAVGKQENGVRISRVTNDGVELIDVELPAVISVTGDINVPRIATMKDIMGAGKKPATIWSIDEVCSAVNNTTEIKSILAPEKTERKNIIIEGNREDAIKEFADFIRKEL